MPGIKIRIYVHTISKLCVVFVLGSILFTSSSLVLADEHQGHFRDDRGQARERHVSHHYYHNGNWYRHGWFGWGVRVPVLSAGVYVDTLPPAYTPVVIQGTTYYYGDNTYFRSLPEGGYTVVAAPSSQ